MSDGPNLLPVTGGGRTTRMVNAERTHRRCSEQCKLLEPSDVPFEAVSAETADKRCSGSSLGQ